MAYTIGGINLGNLPDYLFFFANGSVDANWQGSTKGFIGDVAVNGIQANDRTSLNVPYAGTIFTNDTTLGDWQAILDQNPTQATGATGQVTLINSLNTDLVSAIQQINALPPTPGFESVASTDLDGLNTQNGINEVFIINITSGLDFSKQINITGDAGDVFILRWDEDGDPTNGYQGQLKPHSGGAIVPHGGLIPTNFISVAGDVTSVSTPPPPYPQGPRYDNGQGALIIGGSDFTVGGFFTGYLFTTGAPDIFDPNTGLFYGPTQPVSNGIFVGGWYTLTTQFSMTSGTSAVYIAPNPAAIDQPIISVLKQVSPNYGMTWFDADTPPGPDIIQGTHPQFRYIVSNTGNVPLTDVSLIDSVLGPISVGGTLAPGESFTQIVTGTFALGQQTNLATVTGTYEGQIVTASNPANYMGLAGPSIAIIKYVSVDNGVTWLDANTPPGPLLPPGITPQFRFVVTNNGSVTANNIVVTDDVYGLIGTLPSLAPGASFEWIVTG